MVVIRLFYILRQWITRKLLFSSNFFHSIKSIVPCSKETSIKCFVLFEKNRSMSELLFYTYYENQLKGDYISKHSPYMHEKKKKNYVRFTKTFVQFLSSRYIRKEAVTMLTQRRSANCHMRSFNTIHTIALRYNSRLQLCAYS